MKYDYAIERDEEWKPIKEFPGYSISSNGSVRNQKGRNLKLSKATKIPYLTVGLGKGGKWQIAAMYGVSRTAIYDICNRRSWKHVRRIHPCEKDEVVE